MVWIRYKVQWTPRLFFKERFREKENAVDRRKKWTDNITEWTKKTFAGTQAVAHNRELWTQLVHQSLTVARLRP